MSQQAGFVVAVIGATGAVGCMVPKILVERKFPIAELRLFASSRSAGTTVQVAGSSIGVEEVSHEGLAGVDLAFFAAGSGVSKTFIPTVVTGGGVAIDKSSAFRMDDHVPLVVPEVNGALVTDATHLIANPNCVATPTSVVLAPLLNALGIDRITMATYQAASGGGKRLTAELAEQEHADAMATSPTAAVYPHVLHRNVVPGGWSMMGEDTEEEVKVCDELRKILDDPRLAIDTTTVRVPVMVGHAAAIWIDVQEHASAHTVRDLLSHAAGVVIEDDPERQIYPTPRTASGTDTVHVGRIRVDPSSGRIALFWAADNLRKGAATNAVQIAELVCTQGALAAMSHPR